MLEQLACEVPSESAPLAMLKAPFRAFLGFSVHESVYFYSWLLILALYLVLYFIVPISVLNSSNGFKSGAVVLLWSLILFAVIVMAYVIWNRSSACESKRQKALHYLNGRKASLPRVFASAAQRAAAIEIDRRSGREPVPWQKLEPEAERPKKLPF